MFFECIAFSPHAIQHRLSRKHPTWRLEKMAKDLKLFRSEIHQFAADPYFVSVEIHLHAAHRAWSCGLCRQLHSAKDGANTGHERACRLVAESQIGAPSEIVQTLLF